MCSWPLCVSVHVHKVKHSWRRAMRLSASRTGKGGHVNFAWFKTGVWENLISEALSAPADIQTEWGLEEKWERGGENGGSSSLLLGMCVQGHSSSFVSPRKELKNQMFIVHLGPFQR